MEGHGTPRSRKLFHGAGGSFNKLDCPRSAKGPESDGEPYFYACARKLGAYCSQQASVADRWGDPVSPAEPAVWYIDPVTGQWKDEDCEVEQINRLLYGDSNLDRGKRLARLILQTLPFAPENIRRAKVVWTRFRGEPGFNSEDSIDARRTPCPILRDTHLHDFLLKEADVCVRKWHEVLDGELASQRMAGNRQRGEPLDTRPGMMDPL